jgi:hypothetical protein
MGIPYSVGGEGRDDGDGGRAEDSRVKARRVDERAGDSDGERRAEGVAYSPRPCRSRAVTGIAVPTAIASNASSATTKMMPKVVIR